MQIKLFSIPILGGEKLTEEMNAFLRSKKVLQTENHLVNNGQSTFWCFCIKYLEDITRKGTPNKKRKVDYSEILDEGSYKRFLEMKVIRKRLAQEEGIPAYAIFTDEEMAGLSKKEELTMANMKTIRGVGEKKIEKYGHHFISKNEKSQ